MTNIELVLNMLAEVTTTALSKNEQLGTFNENINVAKRGGSVAGNAKKKIEKQLGESVISPLNVKNKSHLEIATEIKINEKKNE